ncbi:serine/threonine protein kinase [Pendulispora albinea]|uniref:Serine/threonine protein kinase n=1 Tax=Pendulispora albinea TaxID=2741071 RepID=A0ABZ2M943_9BACT
MSESTASEHVIGKYQLIADLEQGGMGNVYIAMAQGPGSFSKLVVLKELKPEFARDPDFLAMFYEEARVASRLHHPNIVHTYEVGSEGDRHFIAMEYLSGQSLARVLSARHLGFPLEMYLRVLCEVLRALEYAHALTDFDGSPMGLVHRDVNPENVFVTYDGQVKLLDFGIAKAKNSRVKTRVGVFKGKPWYMAPEQLTGDITVRTDFFAIGVMIWEAVAGSPMWHQKSDAEVLSLLSQGTIPSLGKEVPGAHPELVRICDKARAVAPEDRYASAVEFLGDIEAYLREAKEAVSVRDVSARVADMFASERNERRETLETYLGAIRATSVPNISAITPRLAPGESIGGSRPRLRIRQTPSGTAKTEVAPSESRARWPWFVGLAALALVVAGLAVVRPRFTVAIQPEVPGFRSTEHPTPAAPPEPAATQATPPAGATPPASAAAPVASGAPAAPAAPAASNASPSPNPAVPVVAPTPPVASSSARFPFRPPARPGQPTKAAPRSSASAQPSAAPPAPSSAPSCDPPFYYEGTKKLYKPGCI